jgi:hypothetical protein
MNRYLILISLLFVTACQSSPQMDLGQLDLSEVICQQGDLPEDFVQSFTTDKKPTETDLDRQIVDFYMVVFSSGSPAYTAVFCSISLYPDHETAQQAFDQACSSDVGPMTSPDLGEQACRCGEGVVTLALRRGPVLAVIQADTGGFYVDSLAAAVDQRLLGQ